MSNRFERGVSPEGLGEKRYSVELKGGASIVVEETRPGQFKIVEDSISERDGDSTFDKTNIAFDQWDQSVEDLDRGNSSVSQLFDLSVNLKWEDVELTPDEITAPSLDRLKEALKHIEIVAYCPGNI